MQNIVTLGEINDALKIAAVSAAQLADMGFAALANKPICEGLPPEESRRLRNAKLYPAESIGQIRVALAQRLAAPATMQASVSNATCQAAPAAVAVPDERAAFEAKFRNLDLSQKPDAWGHARYSHDAISLAWEAWQARAALAATPAATPSLISSLKSILADADAGPPTDSQWCCKECGQWTPWNHPEAHDHEDGCTAPREYAKRRDWKSRLSTLIAATPTAAAPVVLPEPVATIYTMEALVPGGAVKYHAQVHKALPSGTKLLAEPDVRALLATATGLPAQAVAATPAASNELGSPHEYAKANGLVLTPFGLINRDASKAGQIRTSDLPDIYAAPKHIETSDATAPVAPILKEQAGDGLTDDTEALQAGNALLATATESAAQAVEQGEVLVTVSGFTGSGKSAIAGEIEILCRALGLQVQWPDGDSEKNMTHADWTAALEQYKPRVRIVECNVPHPFVKGQDK